MQAGQTTAMDGIETIILAHAHATLIIDKSGVVRFANAAAQRLFHRDHDALVNRPFGVPIAAGRSFQITIVRPDGGRTVARGEVKKALWNQETAYVATLQDVTVRKRTENALRSARRQAEQENERKSHFLASMSHELRTPLNSILGFSEVLEMELFGALGSDKYREYVRDIRHSGLHLLALINDLLDLNKAEAGHMTLNETRLDLKDTVEAAVRTVAPTAEAKGVALAVDFLPHTVEVRADEQKLTQILLNLLSNAVKFTPSGGSVRLLGKLNADGEYVLHVRDTGIGIAEREIPRLFSPYAQVDSDYARQHCRGTGLGLLLSKKLMELHGGTIALDSKVGSGTTVSLRFPAERVLPRPCAEAAAGAG